MNQLSTLIDQVINETILKYDNTFNFEDNSFEGLISFGELVDRLSIINFKLYRLKDTVMDNQDNEQFKAWASTEDVKLVMERARLKKCIDEKLIYMVNRINNGNLTAGFNPEVKKYGN